MIDRSIVQSERYRTHWGAIAFTLTAGIVASAGLTLAVRDASLPSAGLPRIAEEDAASAPPARPTTTAEAAGVTAPAVKAPAPHQVAATLVNVTGAPVIYPGMTATIVYIFRNTGATAWVKGSPSEARLGLWGDDRSLYELGMAVSWPAPTRPARQSEAIVLPGGTAQFDFRVKGTTPGRYQLLVAPVIEGVAWTEPAVPLDITVR